MKKILIIGGMGFIGHNLAILLKKDKIILLVIKLIAITTKEIEATIIREAKPWETTSLRPLEVKKLIISS